MNISWITYLEVVKDGRYRHALTKFWTSPHTWVWSTYQYWCQRTPLYILWDNWQWKALYFILRCHRLRAPVPVWENKLKLSGLLWPRCPWKIHISIDVRKHPNIDLDIKIYLRRFQNEERMISVKIIMIMIIMTSAIISLLRNIYTPVLSVNGPFFTFLTVIVHVYESLASHIILHVYMVQNHTVLLHFIGNDLINQYIYIYMI